MSYPIKLDHESNESYTVSLLNLLTKDNQNKENKDLLKVNKNVNTKYLEVSPTDISDTTVSTILSSPVTSSDKANTTETDKTQVSVIPSNIPSNIPITNVSENKQINVTNKYYLKYDKYDHITKSNDDPSLKKDAKHLYLKYKYKYLELKNKLK